MKTIFLFSAFILFISCNTQKNIYTITIASKQVDCQGVIPQKCMLIKKGSDKEWQNFYETIEGFNYELGFEYVLKIEEQKIENPPADASSLKYKLIKEISKNKKDH